MQPTRSHSTRGLMREELSKVLASWSRNKHRGRISCICHLKPSIFASSAVCSEVASILASERITNAYTVEGSNNMRIVVDLNRCQGYAQCVPLAPTVLKLNGEEALTYDPNPDDSLRQQVLRAAASCPVRAIIVDQLDEEEKKA
jgi:ferredoxin